MNQISSNYALRLCHVIYLQYDSKYTGCNGWIFLFQDALTPRKPKMSTMDIYATQPNKNDEDFENALKYLITEYFPQITK